MTVSGREAALTHLPDKSTKIISAHAALFFHRKKLSQV
jgi:hypothetical protein